MIQIPLLRRDEAVQVVGIVAGHRITPGTPWPRRGAIAITPVSPQRLAPDRPGSNDSSVQSTPVSSTDSIRARSAHDR